MNQKRVLQGLLALWGIWNILNGVLSTFAQEAGASLIGWAPAQGWTPDLTAMAQQYGMALLLLGIVYLIAATDPARYKLIVWVIIIEQVIGLVLSAYAAFGQGQLTTGQFLTQAVINLVVMALFFVLRTGTDQDGVYGARGATT